MQTVAHITNDRLCKKGALKLGATLRDGTVHTMSFEKCSRCGETAFVVRAVKWGVAYAGKLCEVSAHNGGLHT